jgi:phosphatidylethanolamine-binding protein (PEBP) family uncharacterized protein
MRQPLTATVSASLLMMLALTGCGSGATATNISSIAFRSPAVRAGKVPALYTCDGKDISPPLEWGTVPSGIKQLALILVHYVPVGTRGSLKISVAWAVAGINPALHRIAAGEMPSQAHAGIDEGGISNYSICPPAGEEDRYQFTLYALPPSFAVPLGFSDGELFNLIATGNTRNSPPAAGAFVVSYKRR